MSAIPTISITEEHFPDDVAEEATETTGLNINDIHTDVENLDSGDEDFKPSKRKSISLGVKKAKCDALTDVEDMNDSGSDAEEAKSADDIEISLEEFLDQGYVEEATKYAGHKQHMSDAPPKEPKRPKTLGLSLGVEADDKGAVTDCENMNASDDEEESENFNEDDKPLVLEEANTVESHDLVKNDSGAFAHTPIHLTTTGESTSSSEESLNEADHVKRHLRKGFRAKQHGPPVSDTENIMFSDNEMQGRSIRRKIPLILDGWEEVTIQLSGDEDESVKTPMFPEIDITFAGDPTKDKGAKEKQSQLLKVDDAEDGLTDVENLNSSDDDEDDDQASNTKRRQLIPPAVLKSNTGFLTDTEDVDEVESELEDTPEISLPAPTRELVEVREDRVRKQVIKPSCGETLGIIGGYIDKGLTDVEDLSDDEDSSLHEQTTYTIDRAPDLESGNTFVAEKLTAASKLAISSQTPEPLTDTEDLCQTSHPSRRRKHKHRCSGRGKPKLLEIKNQCVDGGTDIEELDLSDTEGVKNTEGGKHKKEKRTSIAVPVIVSNDGATDVEYVSADDLLTYEGNIPNMEASSLAGHTFVSTVLDTIGGPDGRKKVAHVPVIRKVSLVPDGVCCSHTDTEDVGMPSDQDDETYSRARTATPFEVHQALDDSSFTIHDRSINAFDVQTEKLNIKGHRECQEAHTDVEYVDDEARRE
ncbi:uncharacterized protein LOC129791896 [Lutzomyia longipalpis]|uniref:uncharacterized protein LOC129786928 n=1 Tax=Lutzomyia longipalpis TaxID=7200 RepID=UPI00248359F6|nr:uncharacterized protein LOC129786928 [Lutzomyia longipalpis]XP_055686491.1 uncharacterized protein LOC129791896 [Lutzomyia longipalpis]XP_055686499.1 uncharacterized protein LOC129791896 [Lutzomyia longipalpis]